MFNHPPHWLSLVLKEGLGLEFLRTHADTGQGGAALAVQNREAGTVAVHAVLIFGLILVFSFTFF